MTVAPEFSCRVPLRDIGAGARPVSASASADQCAALARRFGLLAIDSLAVTGEVQATAAGISATGRLQAQVTQACVATGKPVGQTIDEPLALLFVPPGGGPAAEEIELSPDDCDQIEHDGQAIDLGEAAAQTLALLLDPFPRAPDADETLARAGVLREGEEATGPFAALKALKPQSP